MPIPLIPLENFKNSAKDTQVNGYEGLTVTQKVLYVTPQTGIQRVLITISKSSIVQTIIFHDWEFLSGVHKNK